MNDGGKLNFSSPPICLMAAILAVVAYFGTQAIYAQVSISGLLHSNFMGENIQLKRSTNLTLVIHSATATPTNEQAMFDLRTGGGAGTSVFSVDEDGDLDASGTLTYGGTTVTATASEINQALDGIGNTVTPANLKDICDTGTATVHTHSGSSPYASGVIVMWSGTLATIPSGWKLCDGTNSTPDLTGRFVFGVPNDSTDPGTTGGVSSISLTDAQMATHSHTGSTGNNASNHNHTASITAVGNHTHSYSTGGPTAWQKQAGANSLVDGYSTAASVGFDGWHQHTVTLAAGVSHAHTLTTGNAGTGADSIDNRPKFYTIAYIMKE